MADVTPNTTSSNVITNADKLSTRPLLPSTTYSYTSCQISFQNGQEQRSHMKEPWHVLNLKRRIAELPLISQVEFATQNAEQIDNHKKSSTKSRHAIVNSYVSDEETSDSDKEESASPFQCLFCSLAMSYDDLDKPEHIFCWSFGDVRHEPMTISGHSSVVRDGESRNWSHRTRNSSMMGASLSQNSVLSRNLT